MRMKKLDRTDHLIVAALNEDGRMSFAEIARRIGVSPSMVRKRYQRLVDEGVVQVVGLVSPYTMGYSMMAQIGLRVDALRVREIAEQIARMEHVEYLVICAGRYNLSVEVVCTDHDDLLCFMNEELCKIDGVHEAELLVYLEVVKEIYSWAAALNPPIDISHIHQSSPRAKPVE